MEKLLLFLNSVDWIFAAVVLIGGRYWGKNYFTVSKRPALNFLAFASVFGAIWLVIKYLTVGITGAEVGNLFITYLFVTSFYEVLGQYIFERIESLFPSKKKQE
jgi:tryptophan-rich sensory protein